MFFCTSAFFSLPAAFFFLVLSTPGHAGSPPEHHGASVGPGRGPWHGLWGFKVASHHGEVLRARRATQAHANPRTWYRLKKFPTAQVISRILNVVSVVRHYLMMERYFPDTNLRDMRPRLRRTKRYNLHDLGRIVSSHARSCVEDMTTRWLGLHPRPTAVRI